MSSYVTIILSATVFLTSTEIFSASADLQLSDTECSMNDQLSIATLIIENVQRYLPKGSKQVSSRTGCAACGLKPMDCSDIYMSGSHSDGIYEIWPQNRIWTMDTALSVFCDMTTDGGGWTVIQRRGDFGNAAEYFNQDWNSYKAGFGDLEKEFWLGNDNLFILTSQKSYELRIDMGDWEGNVTYATYEKFWVDDEFHKYTLHLSGYNGKAGDSLSVQSSSKFTTKDMDNDVSQILNCAAQFEGGWWFQKCYDSFLNGPYYRGKHDALLGGVHCNQFRGTDYALKDTSIKIRPSVFRKSLSSN